MDERPLTPEEVVALRRMLADARAMLVVLRLTRARGKADRCRDVIARAEGILSNYPEDAHG